MAIGAVMRKLVHWFTGAMAYLQSGNFSVLILNSLLVSAHHEVYMLIAQITDLHAARDNDHLQRLEQVLSWLEQAVPDIMVLSGDLTDGAGMRGTYG